MTKTAELLSQIIAIPSYVDADDNEAMLCQFIETYFLQNTHYSLLYKQEMENRRFNLIFANKKNPRIVLFGHMDTVLPKQETQSPFEPKVIDGNMYGLGSVDMKAGLAIMLSIATQCKDADLGFVFSVDEEYEFKGTRKLQEITDFLPQTIINLEPTDNMVINGCRGVTEFSFTVHGKSVHAGHKALGSNAIEKTVELTKILEEQLQQLDKDLDTSVNLAYVHGGTLNTSTVGIDIKGLGNVVPNFAKVVCEIRLGNDSMTQEKVEELLKKIANDIGITIQELTFKFFVGMMFTPKEAIAAFEEAMTKVGLGKEYGDINESGYYEVQMLQEKWDSDCIVFGPGPRDAAHTLNEHVSLDSMEKTEQVICQFIQDSLVLN